MRWSSASNPSSQKGCAVALARREWPVAIPIAVFIVLCGTLLARTAGPSAFDAAALPPAFLHNFYGIERNQTGAYRWSRPESALIIPVAAPGNYRIMLVVGGTQEDGARRQTRIAINGAEVAKVSLSDRPELVEFTYAISPETWASRAKSDRNLMLDLHTTPFIPPQDSRALGAILYHVSVEPLSIGSLLLPRLVPGLLILVLAYAAGRVARWKPMSAALVPLVPTLALFGLALADRQAALALTLRMLTTPWPGIALTFLPAATYHSIRMATVAQLPVLSSDQPFWSRRSLPCIVPLLIAIGTRLDRLDARGLWADEGFTLQVAFSPWHRVLGLEGAYDSHPPLHFILVKGLLAILPAASGGRILSAVCGILSVVVLYALMARLAGRAAALGAATALAISPVHIWYSQEARMYAPAALTVLASYLAVLGFAQAERHRWRYAWAGYYSLCVTASVYLVYASFYSLLPQLVLIAVVYWRQRSRAIPLISGGIAALVAFLPWAPQLVATTSALGPFRTLILSPTRTTVFDATLTLIGARGISGVPSYYPGLWEGRESWLLLALFVPATILGLIPLLRRFRWAAGSAAALLLGTFGTAIALSAVSPGFATRTTLVAVFGWCMIIGAACIPTGPRWFAMIGAFALALALAPAGLTWRQLREFGYKEPSRGLVLYAQEVASADEPIVAMDFLVSAYFAAYAPHVPIQRQAYLQSLSSRVDSPGTLWLAYAESEYLTEAPTFRAQLRDAGYERVLHHFVGTEFYLDRFARPGAALGTTVLLDSRADPPAAEHWALPPSGQWEYADNATVLLLRGGDRGARAELAKPASPQRLYSIELSARLSQEGAQADAALECRASDGTALERSSARSAYVPPSPVSLVPPDATGWVSWRVSAYCPRDTVAVVVSLNHRGGGVGYFRDLRIRSSARSTNASRFALHPTRQTYQRYPLSRAPTTLSTRKG